MDPRLLPGFGLIQEQMNAFLAWDVVRNIVFVGVGILVVEIVLEMFMDVFLVRRRDVRFGWRSRRVRWTRVGSDYEGNSVWISLSGFSSDNVRVSGGGYVWSSGYSEDWDKAGRTVLDGSEALFAKHPGQPGAAVRVGGGWIWANDLPTGTYFGGTLRVEHRNILGKIVR